jgi:DNA-directed RNA polymerase specialized sigma24 family protein
MIEPVPDPFEEFARARTPQLLRSAWLLCGHQAEAEDLVQETLAKVFVRMHRRLGPKLESPAAYAQTTLTRTFISARRRRSSTEMPYDDLPVDEVARMLGLTPGAVRNRSMRALARMRNGALQ